MDLLCNRRFLILLTFSYATHTKTTFPTIFNKEKLQNFNLPSS